MSYNDFYGSNAGAPSCYYASLSAYTANYDGGVQSQARVTAGKIIVPQFGPSAAYDSLGSGGMGSACTNYGTIDDAYGKAGGNCQSTYRSTLCGGGK